MSSVRHLDAEVGLGHVFVCGLLGRFNPCADFCPISQCGSRKAVLLTPSNAICRLKTESIVRTKTEGSVCVEVGMGVVLRVASAVMLLSVPTLNFEGNVRTRV